MWKLHFKRWDSVHPQTILQQEVGAHGTAIRHPLESSKQGDSAWSEGYCSFLAKSSVQISLMILEASSSPHTSPPCFFTRLLSSMDSSFQPEGFGSRERPNHMQRGKKIVSWAWIFSDEFNLQKGVRNMILFGRENKCLPNQRGNGRLEVRFASVLNAALEGWRQRQ